MMTQATDKLANEKGPKGLTKTEKREWARDMIYNDAHLRCYPEAY